MSALTRDQRLPHQLAGAGIAAAGLGPGIVTGFAAAVAMWCVWFITHLPAVRMSSGVTGPLILGSFVLTLVVLLRRGRPAAPITAGITAGLVAAAINLLLLGSMLTETPDGATEAQAAEFAQLRPDAPLIVLGFATTLAVLGAASGWLASRRAGYAPLLPARSRGCWTARFGLVAAVSIAPLLFIGGLVTSTESGMAVPDWPGTYGSNMFLYPLGLMAHPRIYLEHTHRLFGALVGLTTLTLMLSVMLTGRGAGVRWLALGLFLAVCVQGVLGGVRVTENLQVLAMAHGISGQAVFALAMVTAVVLRPSFTHASSALAEDDGLALAMRRAKPWAIGTLVCLSLQLLMGAAYRHLADMHALIGHIVFSLVATAAAAIAGLSLIGKRDEGRGPLAIALGRIGVAMAICVFVQFSLGWIALAFVKLADDRGEIPTAEQLESAPPVPVAEALFTTLHQANGALLLALAVAAAVWTVRLGRKQAA